MKKLTSILSLAFLFTTLISPSPVQADNAILYVSSNGSGDCSSWASACALQSALGMAVSGDEIWVKAGIYNPGSNRSDTFTLRDGVAIYGGFASDYTGSTREDRDWANNQTLLSGDITGPDVYHVVTASGTGITTILDGFKIAYGEASGTTEGDQSGGGMYNLGGSPTLANIIFDTNYAVRDGGGMYNSGGSQPYLENVSFTNNSANPDSSSYGYGGGMQNEASSPILENVRFENNQAKQGGALSNINMSNPQLISVTFEGNSALYGGGIFNNTDSELMIDKAEFINNSADLKGGGIFNTDSKTTITNAIFYQNTASTAGGGIHNFSSTNGLSLTAQLKVINATFFGNQITEANHGLDGGGIGTETLNPNRPSSTTIINTLLWENTSQGGNPTRTQISEIGLPGTTTITYSTIQNGGWPGEGNMDVNPRFLNAALGDLRLQGNSPAIDQGDPANCPSDDLGYSIRPADGDGDGDAICDMGAFEYSAVVFITRQGSTPTNQSSVAFNVTFSASVNSVDPADFAIIPFSPNKTLAGTSISGVTGSGKDYVVVINTGSGNGAFRIDIPASASIAGLDSDLLPYTSGQHYFLARQQTFGDVSPAHWAWVFIERLYAAGITGGCSTTPTLLYCPEDPVTRAQMAIFLLRGKNNEHYPAFIPVTAYSPPPINGSTGFSDVANEFWAAPWIKQLAKEGITSGCGPGLYCPEDPVTRAQMAVFILKVKYGLAYAPPALGSGSGFNDVPNTHWAASWIKQLATEGITGGCGDGNYCPENPVTREQMAVFLVKTFALP